MERGSGAEMSGGGGGVEVERWEERSGVETAGRGEGVEVEKCEGGSGEEMARGGGGGLRWRGGRTEVVWKWLGWRG